MNSDANPRKRHEEDPGPGNRKKPRKRRTNNNRAGRGGNTGNHGDNNISNSRNRNTNNSKPKDHVHGNDNMDVDASNTSASQQKTVKNLHQFSNLKFSNDDSISAHSKKALTEVLNYEFMTKVQEATLPSILEGKDVVAKAKTGSGKTTAFLLPIIERLAVANQSESSKGNSISAVVLSPTRELANQIAVEFEKLATFHPKMKSQSITLIGGTNIDKDKKRLQRDQSIRVLIATPGRLQDHLTQNTANIVERLAEVDILCLDEADRLLDMGFRNELEKIMEYMPRQHGAGEERQTLLFSATFPDVMKDITKLAMRDDFELIDTLDENEHDTNVQVVQKLLVTPLQHHLIALEHVLQEHIEERKSHNLPYKIIVFFTTARIAGFMAELFRADPRFPHYNDSNLLEMHSRKSQSYRTNVAKKFTQQSNVVLFSSDVSARGVDYPDVTAVVQVGAPSDKAQYVHRLGRTARAGNSGIGVIILSEFEQAFSRDLSDLEVEQMTMQLLSEEAEKEQKHFQQLLSSDSSLRNSANAAYQAFLGYYNSNVRRLNIKGKNELVQIANNYATIIGFPEGQPPALQAKTVGKMQLKGVPGLNVEKFQDGHQGGGRGRGRAAGPGRGRGGRGGRGRGRR